MVEDDATTRDALYRLLREHGWQVTLASTLREALGALRRPVQWVVLDLLLPDGEGIEVLELIRRRGLKVNVVVVTAVTASDDLNRVRALAPEALLHKPAEFNQLLKVLEG